MSHSQFHSTRSLILRHAWLNLWDERMTTGRINQIAILRVDFKNPHTCVRTLGVFYCTCSKNNVLRWLICDRTFFLLKKKSSYSFAHQICLYSTANKQAICLRPSAIHFSAVHRKGTESISSFAKKRKNSPNFAEAMLLCRVNRRFRSIEVNRSALSRAFPHAFCLRFNDTHRATQRTLHSSSSYSPSL